MPSEPSDHQPGTLTAWILADLRARLTQGDEERVTLTLEGLAARYRVSVTPIRRVIATLIREGVLERDDRGRLRAVAARTSKSTIAIARTCEPSPQDQHRRRRETLTREVIMAGLGGASKFFREEETAARMGISRALVRTLFGELAGKGFLEHVPRRGWRCRALDISDMDDYLTVRETLELKALELARLRLDPKVLQAFLDANTHDAQRDHDGDMIDNRFHAYVIEQSGNRYIQEFFARHGAYHAALLDHAAPLSRHRRAMVRQHREILNALLRRDWSAAKSALSEHIQAQRPLVRELLAQIVRDRESPKDNPA